MWAKARAPPPASTRPTDRPARRAAERPQRRGGSPVDDGDLPRRPGRAPQPHVVLRGPSPDEDEVGARRGGRGASRARRSARPPRPGRRGRPGEAEVDQAGSSDAATRTTRSRSRSARSRASWSGSREQTGGGGAGAPRPAARRPRRPGPGCIPSDGHDRRAGPLRPWPAAGRRAAARPATRAVRVDAAGSAAIASSKSARDISRTRRVAAGPDDGRPRLAGRAAPARRPPRPDRARARPVADDDLQPARAHDEHRSGRVAARQQPGAGLQVPANRGRPPAAPAASGSRREQRAPLTVDAARDRGRRPRRRQVHVAARDRRRRRVLVGRADAGPNGSDTAAREERRRTATSRRGRRRPRSPGWACDDHDQERDAQDPADLAGAGDNRGRSGVAPARDRGQGGTAEQGEGRADPDTADHLARDPLAQKAGSTPTCWRTRRRRRPR